MKEQTLDRQTGLMHRAGKLAKNPAGLIGVVMLAATGLATSKQLGLIFADKQ